MEEHRYVLPSNVYPSPNLSDSARPRLPLIDFTGNIQYRNLATTNIYTDQKSLQPRPPTNFLLPTLPSQPAGPPHRSSLEARRLYISSQRAQRTSKPNPIAESQHYRDYRARQEKSGDEDQKWPDDLEDLFLEALCSLPNMGRRKFSINGKPYGRNELISKWLWLGYCESLPPRQRPDQNRGRSRKQVSSHIQVLKGFMRGHPAFDRLFPQKDAPRNGFEDSFKNNPCLRALAEGHLPKRTSQQTVVPSIKSELPAPLSALIRHESLSPLQQGQDSSIQQQLLMPSMFKMYMTTFRPAASLKDATKADARARKLPTAIHTYSNSVPLAAGYSTLEIFPDWRGRFPILAQIHSRNELNCDLIHVEASLELRYGILPEGSELYGRLELLAPGKYNRQSVWRCTQSFYKPADLYGPPSADPRYENVTSSPDVDHYEPGVGTHIHVNFPAHSWAHALQRLSTLEAQFDEAVQTGAPLPTPTTARQYIDQITMFQEFFCSQGPNQSFTRQAILLWTFKKCKAGEKGVATWRYLDPSPPRSVCFSPHPGNSHVISAAMSENFGTWADHGVSSALQLQPFVPPSSFGPTSSFNNLPTPSLQSLGGGGGAADMHFPFPTYGYPIVSAENLSFLSHETHDSDSTLVDAQHSGGEVTTVGDGGVHMDSFLSAASVLTSFDQGGAGLWEAETGTGVPGFESDPDFLAGYGSTVSAPEQAELGSHVWDTRNEKSNNWETNTKTATWDVSDAGLLTFDNLGDGHK